MGPMGFPMASMLSAMLFLPFFRMTEKIDCRFAAVQRPIGKHYMNSLQIKPTGTRFAALLANGIN
jgi:hypothetical protein